jgi:intraflagellar transport protein 74
MPTGAALPPPRPGTRGGLVAPMAGGPSSMHSPSMGATPFSTTFAPAGTSFVKPAPGVPPGTGAGRPGTGRLGTAARLGTAQQRAAAGYAPVGLATEVKPMERPVTNQGMRGIRTATAGPGRQVLDKSFFLGEIRRKSSECTEERDRLLSELETLEKNNTLFSQMRKRHDALSGEVHSLQGTLADYNLFFDKARSRADPNQVLALAEKLEHKNDGERRRIDAMFVERASLEQAIQQAQAEMRRLQGEFEQALQQADESTRVSYFQLQEENLHLQVEVQSQRSNLEEVTRRSAKLEEELRADSARAEALALFDRRSGLEKLKGELIAEAERSASLSGPEERARLLEVVKADNAAIATLQKECGETKNKIASLDSTLEGLEKDLSEVSDGDTSSKYAELQQKESEINAFLARFDDSKSELLAEQSKLQKSITEKMRKISRALTWQANLPSASQFKGMSDDVKSKEEKLNQAVSTVAALQAELASRQEEMRKIDLLDEKIAAEMKELSEKMTQYRQDLDKFADVDNLRNTSEERKQEFAAMKFNLLMGRESFKASLQTISSTYEHKRSQLLENESAQQLSSLEQKLRHYEQNNFHLREFVETKERESNYGPIVADVTGLSNDINETIIRSMNV